MSDSCLTDSPGSSPAALLVSQSPLLRPFGRGLVRFCFCVVSTCLPGRDRCSATSPSRPGFFTRLSNSQQRGNSGSRSPSVLSAAFKEQSAGANPKTPGTWARFSKSLESGNSCCSSWLSFACTYPIKTEWPAANPKTPGTLLRLDKCHDIDNSCFSCCSSAISDIS